MNNLSNSIFTYYLNHLTSLSEYKQFHFASRLHLWDQRQGTGDILEALRPWFTADGDMSRALKLAKDRGIARPDFGSGNTLALRQTYFEQYPQMTEYLPVLLKIMYLRTVYGIDCRDQFGQLFSLSEVNSYAKQLLANEQAIAMLSSQAINFLYTWAHLSEANEAAILPEQFLHIGRSQYDDTNKLHTQLHIYLYTHCIIAASLFYYQPVPISSHSTYLSMVSELEIIVEDQFESINLDNICEFLVSALLLGKRSHLEDQATGNSVEVLLPPFSYKDTIQQVVVGVLHSCLGVA